MRFRTRATFARRLPAIGLVAAGGIGIACPAAAQDLSGQDQEAAAPYATSSAPAVVRSTGMIGDQASTAATAVGRAGERRARADVTGVEPMARIESRVQNRVQNRIRNRIDRNYDPSDTTTSPFETATERERRAGRRPSR